MSPKPPPSDVEAESRLLGAMLLPSTMAPDIAEVKGRVDGSDFYSPKNRALFAAICSLDDRDEVPGPVIVAHELAPLGPDGMTAEELTVLVAGAPFPAQALQDAQIIREMACRRRVLAEMSALRKVADDGDLECLPEIIGRLNELRAAVRGDPALLIEDVADIAARVSSTVTRYLARPVWPGDAYGVLAAEKKVGKTWLVLALAVAVASGRAWLGAYPIECPGPVLLFLGEGGPRKMMRRLRAICDAEDLRLEDLPIRLCHSAPQLTSVAHLGEIRQEVKRRRPALVVVDPLYLSAGGAKSADLYAMGVVLTGIQAICQEGAAALVVVTHWNKTGEGHGSHRMTGAGPAEWGRVLCSVGVEHRVTNPDRSTTATLRVTFEGDEIPETELRLRRYIWSDDPDNLSSALHYSVEVLAGTSEDDKTGTGAMRPATRRVLAVLEAADDWLNVAQIGDRLVADDSGFAPLKKRTIQAACKDLADAGLVRTSDLGTGSSHAQVWRAHEPDLGAENAF